MAARKNHAVKTGTMPEAWRDRIKTSMLLNRLHSHVEGELHLEKSQVTAALGLLKKVVPDLGSMQHSGDPVNPVIVHTSERVPMNREEWLKEWGIRK